MLQLFKVKRLVRLHELVDSNGCQVADSNLHDEKILLICCPFKKKRSLFYLIFGAIFHNFCAEVWALDGAQVLLIRLLIASIFVKHVRCASFYLGLDNGIPECLSLDLNKDKCNIQVVARLQIRGYLLFIFSFALISLVQIFEFLSVALVKSWALVGTHEAPVTVVLDTFHELRNDRQIFEKCVTRQGMTDFRFTKSGIQRA